jgi:PIN domain nuclease of toxin-antitoxin system
MKYDPKQRLSARQSLRHPYFMVAVDDRSCTEGQFKLA